MSSIGLRGPAYDLIKSYFIERKQFVYCNDALSDYEFIKYGVSQGSILGPILFFVIYINDLPNSTNDAHVTMYADDTSFIVTDNDLHALYSKLSRK